MPCSTRKTLLCCLHKRLIALRVNRKARDLRVADQDALHSLRSRFRDGWRNCIANLYANIVAIANKAKLRGKAL